MSNPRSIWHTATSSQSVLLTTTFVIKPSLLCFLHGFYIPELHYYHSHILHMQFTTVTLSFDEMLISVARCWLKKQPNVLIKQAQITP